MPEHEVVVKKLAPHWVACEREVVAAIAEMQSRSYAMFSEIYAWIATQGIKPDGPPLSIYYNHEYTEQDIDVETAAFIEKPGATVCGTERVKLHQLDGVEWMACLLHSGRLDNILETYAVIGKWIQANGYRIAGPCREIYLQPPASDKSLIEIQYPVEKI